MTSSDVLSSGPVSGPPQKIAAVRRLPTRDVQLAIAVGVLALAVRVWGLNSQSLTMDEVAELFGIRHSIGEIVRAADGFPPVYRLILKGWVGAFGPGSARGLSVLCGMLTIPVVWQLGRLVGGPVTAWVAALLTAISPVHVWYAQEARANALYYLLVVSSVWLFSLAMLEDRRRVWAGYTLTAVAGLYTHYYMALVIAALVSAVPFFPHDRRRLTALARAHAIVALAALPWIWLLIPDLQLQSGYAAPHVPLDLKSLAYTLVTFLFGLSVGPSVRDLHVSRAGTVLLEALPWGIAAAAVCLLVARPLWRAEDLRRWTLRLGMVTVVPIVICGAAAATLELGYRVRYIAWGASLVIVLLAAGLARARGSALSLLAATILVGGSLISLANRQWSDRYRNEDLASAAEYLIQRVPSTEPVFVLSGYLANPLAYYVGSRVELRAFPRPPARGAPDAAVQAVKDRVGAGARFWLIYSRPWDGDPGGGVQERLRRQAGLRMVQEWPGVQLYQGRGW